MEVFIELLNMHNIEVIADVRSNPYSRYATHFTGEFLKQELRKRNFKYVFLGKEIGGKPKEEEFYDPNGYLDYSRLASSEKFLLGMDRLINGINLYNVAIMCGEEDPSGCHRHLLISKFAAKKGIEVLHIRKQGVLQQYSELVAEKQTTELPTQLSLFADSADSENSSDSIENDSPWRSQIPIKKADQTTGF